jgi:arylsulfatase A-like enzyme
MDKEVGRVLDAMRAMDIYDRTLIVLTSDHGEEFWDHGEYEHGHSLHRAVLHVPLIIKPPFSERGGRIDTFVSTEDIAPTILDFCGVPLGEEATWAQSLAPFLKPGRGDFRPCPTISTGTVFSPNRSSVLFDRMKYIHCPSLGSEELFDLEADPWESESISDRQPDRLREARALLKEYEERAISLRDELGVTQSEAMEYDEETLGTLRALGYLE